jgi:hypothetical protein
MAVIKLDDPDVWIQACEQQLPCSNVLAIAQHQDKLQYAIILGGGC